jgi:nucleoside-diphosphate-sugar epimerase
MMPAVHVIGASGRSGAALCRALVAQGVGLVPVVRDAAKFRGQGLDAAARVADLADASALAAALGDAAVVVSCAHARHVPAILAAAPAAARLVLLGSTRRFSRWPDAHGAGVRAGEAAFLASGRSGVMLHPTMIYGAAGEDNVRRLAALLRRLPVVPLPGGGRALVQPIHQDDVTRCLLAAVARGWGGPRALVVAGPQALPYAAFVRAVAAAARLPPPRIVAVPAWALMALSPLTVLPLLPRVRFAEVRRLLEDKAFPIDAMVAELGVHPIALAQGLASTFS